jgi:hypothetical protein
VREKREEIGSYDNISIQQSSYGFFNFKKRMEKRKRKLLRGRRNTVYPTTPTSSKDAEENIFSPGCDEEFEEPITED